MSPGAPAQEAMCNLLVLGAILKEPSRIVRVHVAINLRVEVRILQEIGSESPVRDELALASSNFNVVAGGVLAEGGTRNSKPNTLA